ncbi:IS6 family transposase, partial [Undibacterium sp. RTI2.2]|nr:IS6 family transposase [Undibacterium sp. RTI2.2]
RERQMRRFKSSGHAQRFLSAHGPINHAFRCQRNRMTAEQYRHMRTQAFSVWHEVTNVAKKPNP